MYKIFQANKDCYITDRVIRGARQFNANTGKAGSLDLYKLYGITTSASLSGSVPNNELTRLLVQFDLTALSSDVSTGVIDPNSPSFACTFRLVDVYGGQTTPAGFSTVVFPLSQSFDEGMGNDVVFYQDHDVANFLTASAPLNTWFLSGANARGNLDAPSIDVIVSGNLNDGNGTVGLYSTQYFPKGNEDMAVDVTKVISATLAGRMQNNGFRVSFIDQQETDLQTRFVKRFGSLQATDQTKRPQLIVKYDDSIQDNQTNFFVDVAGTVLMFNKVRGTLANLVSGSALTPITGSNCLALTLTAPISGGFYSTVITGSQLKRGNSFVTGVYSASFTLLSATPGIKSLLVNSGSINFTQTWGSLDGTVGFLTASNFSVLPQQGDTSAVGPTTYYVTTTNVNPTYKQTDKPRIRVNIQNVSTPYTKLTKVPLVAPSTVIDSTYYSIRDAVTQDVIVPFDTVTNSTRLSSDGQSMWFDFYMASLFFGKAYVIDIMIVEGGSQRVYRDVCAPFKIDQMS